MKKSSTIEYLLKVLCFSFYLSISIFFYNCSNQESGKNMSVKKINQELNKSLGFQTTFLNNFGLKNNYNVYYSQENKIYFHTGRTKKLLNLDKLFQATKKCFSRYDEQELAAIRTRFKNILVKEYISNNRNKKLFKSSKKNRLPSKNQADIIALKKYVEECDTERVRELLVDRKVDPNQVYNPYSLLYITIKNLSNSSYKAKGLEILQLLLDYGINPNIEPANEKCLFVGQNHNFTNILNNYCNQADQNINGNALYLAVKNKQYEASEILLRHKDIDPNKINFFGETPMYTCIDNNDFKLAVLLLKNNANPNIGSFNKNSKQSDNTPLHFSIYKENIRFIKMFSKIGANPFIKNIAGFNAFDVSEGNDEIIKILLNIKDKHGNYSIHNSIYEGKKELKKLIDLGANLDCLNINNHKSIDLALQLLYLDKIKILLDAKVQENNKKSINTNFKTIENKNYNDIRYQMLNHRVIYSSKEIKRRVNFLYEAITASDILDFKQNRDPYTPLTPDEIFYESQYRNAALIDAKVFYLHNLNQKLDILNISPGIFHKKKEFIKKNYFKLLEEIAPIYSICIQEYNEIIETVGTEKLFFLYNALYNTYSCFGKFIESYGEIADEEALNIAIKYFNKGISILSAKIEIGKEIGDINYYEEYLGIVNMFFFKSIIYKLLNNIEQEKAQTETIFQYLDIYQNAIARFGCTKYEAPKRVYLRQKRKEIEKILYKIKAYEILENENEILPLCIFYYKKSRELYLEEDSNFDLYYLEARFALKKVSNAFIDKEIEKMLNDFRNENCMRINELFIHYFSNIFKLFYDESDFDSCYELLNKLKKIPLITKSTL